MRDQVRVDADGFSITFRDQTHRLGAGDTLRITGTPPGDHVLRLGDVASHCESLSDSTNVHVEPNRDVSVELTVECYGDLLYREWYDHYNDQLFYLDGSGVPRKLTPTLPGKQWSERWSPDGTRVVFERIMPNETDIYIADLQGSVRPLANRAGDMETMAEWSPDGAWIVYVLIEGPEPFTGTDIRLIRPDGSMDHSLFNDGGIGISPVWSPDGQYIAFGCWRAVHSICYVRPNGEWVGAASVTFGAPQWSSDGRQLALMAMENGISHAYVARIDGAEVRLAADSIRWMGGWSPDNARIGIGVAPTSIPPLRLPTAGLPASQPSAYMRGVPAGFNLLQGTLPGVMPLQVCASNYSRSQTLHSYDTLHDAIFFAWEAVNLRSTDKETDFAFLKWMITELERDWLNHAPRPLVPNQFLKPCLNSLFEAASFACLDEPHNCNYTRHRPVVQNRLRLIPNAAPPRDAMIPKLFKGLTEDDIKRLGNAIRQYGAAECLGFAVVAAATILSGVFKGTLTIQTTGRHQFVEFTPTKGPPVIIDLWLGSVGKELFYNVANYPFALPPTRNILFSVTRTGPVARD